MLYSMLVYQNHNNHQGKRIDWYQSRVNRELKQQGELRIVSLAAEILVSNLTILLVYLKFGLNIFYSFVGRRDCHDCLWQVHNQK